MDNLTHTLVGLTAARAGLERVSPYATAVCVVAANLPDADIATLAAGQWTYLEHHRGITHSIVGTLALGVALPLLVFAGDRIIARRRGRVPRARLGGLMLASLLVSATHPLLDWTNSYGVRPLLPWDGGWIYGDLVFIADPWIWLALGGACFLPGERKGWRVAAWAALAVSVTVALFLLPRRAGYELPLPLLALWLAGVVALAVARASGLGRERGPRVAHVALALVPLYWLGLGALHARALERARVSADELASARGEAVARVAALPMPANPFHWRCLAETEVANHRFDLFLNRAGETFDRRRWEKPRGPQVETVGRAARDPRAQIFLGFARFYDARPTSGDGGARPAVRFTELRFTEPESPRLTGGFTLDVPAAPEVNLRDAQRRALSGEVAAGLKR
ncbi:MAG TPA: metal-dependent hydrolase [Pyrinomonadaceae bacterium]|nr:metal-dependent hydrolase [Pyrinomonadaceae bacterium]